MRAVLACMLVLLVVSGSSLVLFTPAAAAPDGVDDRATFTVRTGAIHPHASEGGQICAEKTAPDVNKITVTNATLEDVDIYLSRDDGRKTHISFPSGDVNGALVLYTNGENALVNTLATLGACLPTGTPNPFPTTLEAYWLGTANLQPRNLELSSSVDAPKPGGPSLTRVLEATNTSPAAVGLNNSSNASTNSTTPPVNRTDDQQMKVPTNNTTKTVAPNEGTKTVPATKTAVPTPTSVPTVESTPPTTRTTTAERIGTNRSAIPTTQTPPATKPATPSERRNSTLSETVDKSTNATNTSVSPPVTDTPGGAIDDVLGSVSTATNETTDLVANTTNTSTTTPDGDNSAGGVLDGGVINTLSSGVR